MEAASTAMEPRCLAQTRHSGFYGRACNFHCNGPRDAKSPRSRSLPCSRSPPPLSTGQQPKHPWPRITILCFVNDSEYPIDATICRIISLSPSVLPSSSMFHKPIRCLADIGGHMRRREFIGALVAAAAWPVTAHAQERVARIGILLIGDAEPMGPVFAALRDRG